ncbi:MAG: sigma-70 family RNA polymerase sigma factor [Solirubrobacteraceae bacterium]
MTPGDCGWKLRLTDEELLTGVARLEPEPFETLYERHGPAAFALAQHMLGSNGPAEDAVQEAFLNLWRSAARYDCARGSVRSWLLCMVRHRSIDILRRLKLQERHRIAIAGLEDRIASGEETAANVICREEASMVRNALASLPSEQRRVLELAYYGGWTHTEIAEHFDMPLGTVKGRARLGLEKLRWTLAELARSTG